MADGKFFRTTTGDRWTGIGSSEFNFLGRLLAGEDVEPVIKQRADLGFNLFRGWTLYDVVRIGRLIPSDHPRFYDDLVLAAKLLDRHGIYMMTTAFTGTQRLMPNRYDQQEHLDRLADVIRRCPNLFGEAGNEWEQGDNRWYLDLTWPRDILFSGGSVGSQAWPSAYGLPTLSHFEFHSNLAPEWQRKAAHNAMEIADAFNRPVFASENERFPDNCSRPELAYALGESGALLIAGTVFHSVRGKTHQLWDGQELGCASEYCRGALRVPLRYQAGMYIHRFDLELLGILRAYERRLSDGDGYACLIPY